MRNELSLAMKKYTEEKKNLNRKEKEEKRKEKNHKYARKQLVTLDKDLVGWWSGHLPLTCTARRGSKIQKHKKKDKKQWI